MVAQSLSNISESDGARVSCSECKEVIQEGEMVAQCVGDFDTCPGTSILLYVRKRSHGCVYRLSAMHEVSR